MSDQSNYWSKRPVRRRRFLGVTALGATAAAIAAACGGGDDDSPSTSSSTTAPGASGSPAAQATAAAAGPAVVRGGTLTAVMARDVTNFEPLRSSDVYSSMILSLVAESLYETAPDSKVVGRIAERTENPEPNIYVWKLRQGVKFQDATDLNAEAVKFNLQRHIDDTKSVRAQDVKDITSIETPDPTTVRVTLKGPYAPFTGKLTGGAGYLLSPTAIPKLGENFTRDITGAGAGAYKFVEWKKDTQVVIERSDTHWKKDAGGGALPYLDRIIFKPFSDENVRLTNLKTGDADILVGNPPYKDIADLKKDSALTVKDIPGIGYSLFFLNTEREPFNNPAIRRAFSYAIDREQIIKTVYFENGKVLDLPVPQSLGWAYATDHPYMKRDVAKAKQEMTASGKTGTQRFTFQISNASVELQQVAELVKDQIKEVGLEMDIQLIEFATVLANAQAGTHQSLGLGWSGDTDPDTIYSLFYTKAGFNFSKYSNPQFDKLLDDGRATLDQAKRGDIYKQAQKILADEQPALVYFNAPQISTVRKNVQNYPQTYNGYWGARDYDKMFKQR